MNYITNFTGLYGYSLKFIRTGINTASLFITVPLKILYYNIYWKTNTEADICSRITTVESSFWTEQAIKCTELIERDFQNTVLVTLSLVYLFSVFFVLIRILYKYTK